MRSRPQKIAELQSERELAPPSRAQKKRDLEKLRQFGKTLMELPPGKFAKLPLPEALRSALVEARRLSDNNARRRQLQFIQAVLEQEDSLQIRLDLDHIDRLPAPAKVTDLREDTAVEKLAGQLLDGGDPVVFALSTRYEASELQMLRQAVRKARKDLAAGKAREVAEKGVRDCLARLS